MPASGLTPDDVRDVAFGPAPPGGRHTTRGYHPGQVDAFLARVEQDMRAVRPRLTAADISGVTFGKPGIGRRGYSRDEVDAFLDAVEVWYRDRATP